MTNVPVISYPCKLVCHRVFDIDFVFIAHLYKYQNVKTLKLDYWPSHSVQSPETEQIETRSYFINHTYFYVDLFLLRIFFKDLVFL